MYNRLSLHFFTTKCTLFVKTSEKRQSDETI